MHIIIAGAGEVGFLVASELSEEHDITMIDKDLEACSRLAEMDVKVLQGNAANVRILLEAGIKQADLMLAVTGNDEVNVIACIIAAHIGVTQTIARASNPEYIDRPVQHRKEIGISYMICPELVLAEQMAQSLYFPSMLMNRELAGGRLQLMEFKIDEDMPFQGPIKDIELPKSCRMLALNKAGNISIPSAGDNIMPKDHMIIICKSEALSELRGILGEEGSRHKAMIVGGGMVGFYLAGRLERMGFDVKLVEINQQRCHEIADVLSKTMILCGDGTDISLLKEEQAGEMDVVFAVTGVDEKNLLCSLLVKQLGTKKILSRVNRMTYANLFELVGVDKAISPGQVTADVVLQKVLGVEEVVTLSDERIELMDIMAKDNSKIVGKNLIRMLPAESIAGMVLRGETSIIPDEHLRVEKGDRVFVMAMLPAVSKVKKLFVA
ncbi:MAG: Trk system potassium transporter TrkA [Methanotrichaceae archaeon]|nr:Trk system potassium transporter TrkA [Methanotrichaceae archaeon]